MDMNLLLSMAGQASGALVMDFYCFVDSLVSLLKPLLSRLGFFRKTVKP
jgi:hypothetical protein